MDSEDALREQAEKDKLKLMEEWKQRVTRAVDESKRQQ